MGRNSYLKPFKNEMLHGNLGFFSPKNYRFEYCYFFFLKKLIKLMFIKSRFIYCKTFWYYLNSNKSFFKKSKNSRMGSGKGFFLRYVSSLHCYFIFFELLISNFHTVYKLLFILRKFFFFKFNFIFKI